MNIYAGLAIGAVCIFVGFLAGIAVIYWVDKGVGPKF